MAMADQAASQGKKSFVHESGAFVGGPQAFEAVQPSLHLLGHVTKDSQGAAVCRPASGDFGQDATGTQFLAVVGAVGIRPLRTLAWAARLASDRRDGIDQRQGLGDIAAVGPGDNGGQGRALGVGDHMTFAALFAAVRGVLARLVVTAQRPHFRGVNRRTASIDFVRAGILLDPVYSGKAFAGLLADVRRGALPSGAAVLFIMTDGTPSLFAYRTAVDAA